MQLRSAFALAVLAASGSSQAASPDPAEVDAVIKNLDLSTFANSVGPRRMPGKKTFADYGFIHVEKTTSAAKQFHEDNGWLMSFNVISANSQSLRLCFHDQGLARPGDSIAPSYQSTSALLVTKTVVGMWAAKQVPAGFENCRNDPPAA
jgi:hypothetical protein